MSWEVAYSEKVRQDLRSIYEYMADGLCVPDTAVKQAGRILQHIKSLSKMPLRYRLYEVEPWHNGAAFLSRRQLSGFLSAKRNG